MCRWLAKAGHDVKVVSSPPYYPDWKIGPGYKSFWFSNECLDGVEILRCPLYVPTRPSTGKRLVHHLSYAISCGGALAVLIRQFRPDLVFAVAPSILAAPGAANAARAIGAASWLHFHDF